MIKTLWLTFLDHPVQINEAVVTIHVYANKFTVQYQAVYMGLPVPVGTVVGNYMPGTATVRGLLCFFNNGYCVFSTMDRHGHLLTIAASSL